MSICRFPIDHYKFKNGNIEFYNNYNLNIQYESRNEILNVYISDNILLFEVDCFSSLATVYLVMFYLENKITDFNLFKKQIEMEKIL